MNFRWSWYTCTYTDLAGHEIASESRAIDGNPYRSQCHVAYANARLRLLQALKRIESTVISTDACICVPLKRWKMAVQHMSIMYCDPVNLYSITRCLASTWIQIIARTLNPPLGEAAGDTRGPHTASGCTHARNLLAIQDSTDDPAPSTIAESTLHVDFGLKTLLQWGLSNITLCRLGSRIL